MAYKYIIFDFDGTLMDTSESIMATIRETIHQMDLPERTDQECRSIIGIRTVEAGRVLYPDVDISNEEFARVFRSIYPGMQQRFPAQPFPGVMECVESLVNKGLNMAIASSRRKGSLVEIWENGGGDVQWFQIIVGAEDVTKGKPDPEPALKILKTVNWSPSETLVVGDADVDILMGNRAGCDTCAVTYGNGSLTTLKAAHPTYIVDTFTEVAALACGN